MWITLTHIGIHSCILQHTGLDHHKVCLMNRFPLKSMQYQKNSALSVQSFEWHSPCSTQNKKSLGGPKFMKDEMAFRFNHSNGQQLSCSLKVEPISIGCEAWIDVDRFCVRNNLVHPTAGDIRASEDHSRSTLVHGSLTKSFARLRRKLRRGAAESPG